MKKIHKHYEDFLNHILDLFWIKYKYHLKVATNLQHPHFSFHPRFQQQTNCMYVYFDIIEPSKEKLYGEDWVGVHSDELPAV